jgi:hypothetical protein
MVASRQTGSTVMSIQKRIDTFMGQSSIVCFDPVKKTFDHMPRRTEFEIVSGEARRLPGLHRAGEVGVAPFDPLSVKPGKTK